MTKKSHAMILGTLLVAASGCSGDDGAAAPSGGANGSAGAAGISGGASGASGVGGAGESGTAGTSAGGAGGAGGAGNAGESGAAGGAATGGPGLENVDLTLDGFNQDLPAPTYDCLDGREYEGCISFSGEYNGMPVDVACPGGINVAFASHDSSRGMRCRGETEAGYVFHAGVKLAPPLFGTTSGVFEATHRAGAGVEWDLALDSFVPISNDLRALATYLSPRGFLLEATHTIESRMAGEAYLGPGRSADNTSEFARGVFAVSLTPLPSCTPDADGLGCDTVRLRGTFSARTLSVVTFYNEGGACGRYPSRTRCAEGLECEVEPGEEFGVCATPM